MVRAHEVFVFSFGCQGLFALTSHQNLTKGSAQCNFSVRLRSLHVSGSNYARGRGASFLLIAMASSEALDARGICCQHRRGEACCELLFARCIQIGFG